MSEFHLVPSPGSATSYVLPRAYIGVEEENIEEEEDDEDMSVEDETEEEEERGADFEGMDEDEFENVQSSKPLNKIELTQVKT